MPCFTKVLLWITGKQDDNRQKRETIKDVNYSELFL